jgi:hypothetical protein
MKIGHYYKSINKNIIVQCEVDFDVHSFAGHVVDTGDSDRYYVGEFQASWQKKYFEYYGDSFSKEPTTDQIGGSHYKNLKIQPTLFIHANNIGFIEGNIIKYVVRHKDKNGIEDLKKARHYIDLLIKFEYEDPKKL